MRKLLLISILAVIFMITEIVGGFWSGSLAILTDAAHQLSDVAGFMASFGAIYLSQKPKNAHRTFGQARYEVMGAVATVLIIWTLLGVLIYESIERIIHLDKV